MKNGTHEPEWKMPRVELGMTVLWNWNRAGPMASTGVVIAVGEKTISLALHTTNTKDHTFRLGAHHKDDPWLKQNPNHEGGVWELTPRDVAINEVLAAFEAKKAAVRVAPSLAGTSPL